MRGPMRALTLPKGGNRPEEFEDAYWLTRPSGRQARVIRCAVADGATEASFSGLWADMLVRAFGRGQIRAANLLDGLRPLQAAWWADVGHKPLPWYAEEKVRSGAFSSLLGLSLNQRRLDTRVVWTAMAVGDTCLFVVRDHVLVASFPLRSADSFDSTPHLISSVSARNTALNTVVRQGSGLASAGDRFYLMTDALACWFLTRFEAGEEPWETLDSFLDDGSQEEFMRWMTEERDTHRIRNDDVTLLRLCLE